MIHAKTRELKSDLRGIETYQTLTESRGSPQLKSDLRGIETPVKVPDGNNNLPLKSDLRGIETEEIEAARLGKVQVKIRP